MALPRCCGSGWVAVSHRRNRVVVGRRVNAALAALVVGVGGERFAVVVDHSHFEDGSDPSAPPTLTAAVLPRGAAAALVMLGVFAAVAIFARFSTLPSLVPVRGPPRTGQVVGAGRDLLIRFCVDRC